MKLESGRTKNPPNGGETRGFTLDLKCWRASDKIGAELGAKPGPKLVAAMLATDPDSELASEPASEPYSPPYYPQLTPKHGPRLEASVAAIGTEGEATQTIRQK